MMIRCAKIAIVNLLPILGCLLPIAAIAQTITPDGTTPTTITTTGLDHTITNGTAAGSNLFHSFQRFDIPTGGSATFDLVNTPAITTIFSRVTGGSLSNIDGLIRTTNSTNPVSLFLMNPSGIIFGPNASLNIGGSFVGTTASSIKFANGAEFAGNAVALPASLLTINVPIGLQMGQNPGAIVVQNTGHRLIAGNAPLQMGTTPSGLQVATGNTLALIGGDIALEGGILSAPSGHLELGSVKAGTVNLNTASPRWTFDYGSLQQYGNIHFSRQALANASGAPGGSIHLQGRNISVNEGSVVLSTHQENRVPGTITVNASEFLEMRGVGTYGFAQGLVVTESTTSVGGSLAITAPQLRLQDGAKMTTRAFGSGIGGNISVLADSIQIVGFSALQPVTTRSELVASTRGSGQAGNIQVTTRQLRAQTGGSIVSSSQGTGATGSVIVDASELIELNGETPASFSASLLGVVSLNRGSAGTVTVNTPRLSVQNGASVAASALGQGDAGTLRVNVSEQISVSGISAASGKAGNISTSATALPFIVQQPGGLSVSPTGNSGDLIINTPRLEITDGGVVRVSHQGVGDAGNLYINADRIFLDRGGSIVATTQSGEGGSISLQATTSLILRHGSNITATAGGVGNGGNITINSPIIAGFENSDIIANAFKGRGGNITITTQGIFGLKFRPQLTPDNDITASSQFGVNGTVQISTPGIEPDSGLVQLAADFADPSQQISAGCAGEDGSSFIATGRGGIPVNPMAEVRRDRTWSDTRDLSEFRKQDNSASLTPHTPHPTSLIEANAIRRNPDGTVELTATDTAQTPHWTTCAQANR
jgi:filamentous hemagglutinin family protein